VDWVKCLAAVCASDCRSSRGTGSSVWPRYARATKEANLAGCLSECNEYLSASRRAIAS
jgi:hypothetical protein